MLDFALFDQRISSLDKTILIEFDKESFLEGILYFKVHHDFLFLLDYNVLKNTTGFQVKVVLQNLEKEKIVVLKTRYSQGDSFFSLKGIWPAAIGWERNFSKKHGLRFNSGDKVDPSRAKKLSLNFDIAHQFPHFLYEDEEERVTSFKVETSGRRVDPEEFHSLKELQNLSKYNPKDIVNAEISYCMAIEKSMNVTIPEKAQAIRMIFSELQRIAHHLEYLIQTHIVLKDFVFINELIHFRRKIYDLFIFYMGKDFDISFNYIGGVSKDIPPGWIPMCNETLRVLTTTLKKTYDARIENSLWNQRFSRFEVSAQKLLNFSVSGPNLRAGGINYDLRRNNPYYFYQDVEFEVPIGIWGTSFDRFLCRVEEIHQSVRIVLQVLDNLPYGDIYAKDERLIYNLQKDLTSTTKQNIYHSLLVKGDNLSPGNFSGLVESARGTTGFILEVSDSTEIHYVGAHFASVYALEENLVGLHRQYLEREIASYGFHPWERS